MSARRSVKMLSWSRLAAFQLGFPILAVFRLKGQPKRDGSIIVRSCKATQSPVYPILEVACGAGVPSAAPPPALRLGEPLPPHVPSSQSWRVRPDRLTGHPATSRRRFCLSSE